MPSTAKKNNGEMVRGKKSSRNLRLAAAIDNPNLAIRELCTRSFYYFLKHFWPQVSNDEFSDNWHIEKLCSELQTVAENVAEGNPKLYDLIINVPPGTTKTITCSIMFPVWCWTRWYWMRFIAGSYSAALSLESAEYSRELVRSEEFKVVYPELDIKADKDTKGNFRVIKLKQVKRGRVPRQKAGGNRYSTSVGGTVMGFHAHILLIDDPLDPEQAVSKVKLETANRWVGQTLSTRKVDKAITPTILIMQRLHQDDPTGMMLKKKKNIRHISLPGEIRNYQEHLKPQEWAKYYKDDLLDSKRIAWTVLKDMEADLGQYGYAGQVGQNPVPPGGGMFKVDNFHIIDKLPPKINWAQIVRYWDKAATDDGGAYTVGVRMISLTSGKWIVTDVKRGQWGTDTREAIIKSTAEADGAGTAVWIEQEPGSGGKDSAQSTIRNLAGFSCRAERPTGDKIFRADPFSVQVNNGNVWLLRGEWNTEFIDEYRHFPFSTYKDQVDAGSGAFSKLSRKRVAGPLLPNKHR